MGSAVAGPTTAPTPAPAPALVPTAAARPDRRARLARPDRRARLVLLLLLLAALGVTALYLTLNARAGWDFVLPFRGRRVAAMVLVGISVSTSTVAFQTLAANRILTPSIMGFDALYQAIQTALVFFLGGLTVVRIGVLGHFWLALAVMLAASLAIFWGLLGSGRRSLRLVLLVGVVIGTLLRALTLMLQRLLDPDAFHVLQGRLFASFSGVDERLLAVGAVVVTLGAGALWALRRRLDVLALGRDTAISLGLSHRRVTLAVITVVALLVSTSTALVGPITFFGLLVAHLAYPAVRSHRHALTLPAAALLSVVVLVGGQTVLEHLLGQATLLSVVIEFIGGIVFIALLVAQGRRR